MKKTLSGIGLATMASASSSGASNALMSGLSAIQGTKQIPEVPYVSELVRIGDVDCCLHTYDPDAFLRTPPKALVVFLHGWNAHGTMATTKLVADLMVKNGYAFVAPDLPGHGRSSGVRGFPGKRDTVVDVASGIISHAYRGYLEKVSLQKASQESSGSPGLKLFVVGSSMGGNLSLQASLRNKDISGVILMAPMLRIAIFSNTVTRFFLSFSSKAIPMAEIIPVTKSRNYRCPKVNQEVENDTLKPHKVGDRARIGSAASLMELTDTLDAQFENVRVPCLVMVADEDTTVDNQGAVDLVKRARSNDMTLRHYPALHGLMGEPSPLLDRMQDDMISWLDERCSSERPLLSSL